jgi:hypothetical protein
MWIHVEVSVETAAFVRSRARASIRPPEDDARGVAEARDRGGRRITAFLVVVVVRRPSPMKTMMPMKNADVDASATLPLTTASRRALDALRALRTTARDGALERVRRSAREGLMEIGDAFRRARASTPALGKGRRVAVSPCRPRPTDRPTVRPSPTDRPSDRPIAFRSF